MAVDQVIKVMAQLTQLYNVMYTTTSEPCYGQCIVIGQITCTRI